MAEIPLRIVNGHYLIDITLDGKRLVAMIDTGSSHSSIGLAEAQHYFGLSPVSPDMLPAAKANGSVTTYMRKFGVLSFEGIEIHDPNIAVLQTDFFEPGARRGWVTCDRAGLPALGHGPGYGYAASPARLYRHQGAQALHHPGLIGRGVNSRYY
jgi:hypothetical protein